ncbi:MAG: DNA gyrase inhibitor YacG [Rhodospirillales bacterium]|nr:DNA gyrase inhibitor YacG [Rhodospirillales bacterium]MCW8861437.1 DNA gyrase inhibitor YacG [Rhodospirillales bacterium]MCW8951697.1 DNA gyrase inhibitor YacG [Rhodospirillales bacterium]MCW8970974.1 DNA gyrase inhibitor YacG [Rhodospirillales bacterium]MCW9003310.1 DNA gyrase inhibitor YacG [Rhodospirillales bacterium]
MTDGKDPQDAKVVPLRPARCPNCGKPVVQAFRPFCSKRCADVDLGRWLGGHYRIPTNEGPDMETDPFPPDEQPE